MVNSYLPSRFIVSFFFFSSFLVSPGRRTVSSWNCRFFHFSFSPSLPSSLPPSFSLSYFSDFDGAALASTNVLRTIDKDEQLRISHIVLMFFFDAPFFFFFFWNFAKYIYIHTYIYMPYAFCLYYYYCYFFFPFFFCILSSTTTNPPRKTIILYFLLYSTSVLLLLPFPTNRDLLEILYERFTILCDIYFYYHYYLLAIFLLAPFLFFFFFYDYFFFSLSLSRR